MDENSFIVGLQALMAQYIEDNPEVSYEGLDEMVTIALEEVGDEYFVTMEADNDDN